MSPERDSQLSRAKIYNCYRKIVFKIITRPQRRVDQLLQRGLLEQDIGKNPAPHSAANLSCLWNCQSRRNHILLSEPKINILNGKKIDGLINFEKCTNLARKSRARAAAGLSNVIIRQFVVIILRAIILQKRFYVFTHFP